MGALHNSHKVIGEKPNFFLPSCIKDLEFCITRFTQACNLGLTTTSYNIYINNLILPNSKTDASNHSQWRFKTKKNAMNKNENKYITLKFKCKQVK